MRERVKYINYFCDGWVGPFVISPEVRTALPHCLAAEFEARIH